MKLFGKKGSPKEPTRPASADTPPESIATARSPLSDDDYYGSPVEVVSLAGPIPVATAPLTVPVDEAAGAGSAAVAGPPVLERPRFGIDDAVRLMRALPVSENPELVIQVLKTTLESLQIKIDEIIDEASQKEKSLDLRINILRREVTQLEHQVQLRKEEIIQVDHDLAETGNVRQQLLLAVKPGEERAGPGNANGQGSGGSP
jgi:hypothetical protein